MSVAILGGFCLFDGEALEFRDAFAQAAVIVDPGLVAGGLTSARR
jgi:hypothetical protein